MSLAYCKKCLKRFDQCDCASCDGFCDDVVYGDIRVAYIRGYRDAKDGKEMEI